MPLPAVDEDLKKRLQKALGKNLEKAIYSASKTNRETAVRDLRRSTLADFAAQGDDPKAVGKLFESLEKELVRSKILKDGKRPDGRGLKDIRPVSCEVGVLPRAHGSGLFTRGQTQVCSVATLGTESDEQSLDSIGTKRYMHQYNFPPFGWRSAVLRGTPRDIGHGAPPSALVAVLPSKDESAGHFRHQLERGRWPRRAAARWRCSTRAYRSGIGWRRGDGPDHRRWLVQGDYAVLTDIQGIEDALGTWT
jgi:polyribonucleotide nucleotidyltransferase